MSNKAQEWAKAQKVGNSGAKFVLWILSDYAGVDGGSCFPTIKDISEATEFNERSVRRHLDYLNDNNFLTRFRFRLQSGRLSRYNYRLNMGIEPADNLSTGETSLDNIDIEEYIDPPVDKLSSGATSGQFRPSPVDKLSTPKPLLKPLKKKKKKALSLEEFLGEVKEGFIGGEFEEYSLTIEQMEKQAKQAYRYWDAYPDSKPTGSRLSGLHTWLTNSKTVKKLSKQCENSVKRESCLDDSWRTRINCFIRLKGFWKDDLYDSKPPTHPQTKVPKHILSEYQNELNQLQEQK